MHYRILLITSLVITYGLLAHSWQWKGANISVRIYPILTDNHQEKLIYLAGFYAPKTSNCEFNSTGKLVKVLSLGLCREDPDQLHHEAWIGLVYPKESDWYAPSTCNRLAEQTLRAAKRGAVGLVFDLRNAHGHLREQLMEAGTGKEFFNITVTMVDSRDAKNLDLLESLDLAEYHADVSIQPAAPVTRFSGRTGDGVHQNTRATFYAEIAGFLLFFLVFCIAGIVILVKFYSNRDATSTSGAMLLTAGNLPKSVGDKLETHLSNTGCSACLEEFQDNEPVRMLPCRHQFHPLCLDYWLAENQACPLCAHNIMGEPPTQAYNTMETMTTIATASTAVALETPVSDASSSNYSVICEERPISSSSAINQAESATVSKNLQPTASKTIASRETTL